MITRRTLYPGQPGTKKWVKKYGENLLCIRYKYDPENNKKMITVELAEETGDWAKNKMRIPKNKIVQIKVRYGEIDIGRKVRAFGGNWNKEKKVWELPFAHVQALGLTDRIVSDV